MATMTGSELGRFSRHTGWISAGFSLAAFGLSVFTFYFTFLQGPDISAHTASLFSIGGNDRARHTFYTAVTIVNDGGGSAVVERIQLKLQKVGDPDGRVFDAETRLANYQPAGPFAALSVGSQGSVTQDYQFYPIDRANLPLFPEPGDYTIDLVVWLRGSAEPIGSTSHTRVTEAGITGLSQTRYSSVLETVPDIARLREGANYLRVY
jgi:hypothetical protein